MSPTPLRWHVVCHVGNGDTHTPAVGVRDALLPLALQAPGAPATTRVADTVWPALDSRRLSPSPLAIDFYRAAAAVYAADARVPREAGYDRWTREMILHLPVSDLQAWERVQQPFTELLQYLTGDRWEVMLRPGAAARPPVDAIAERHGSATDADAVCLLSGGLDSFVGALDGFTAGRRLLLVSHNAAGSRKFSSPAQDAIRPPLERAAGGAVSHLKITVSPPALVTNTKAESSQRSRSIIFVGLGVLVASALPAGTPLVVPENGFISLNVPLTYGRLGSLSTRTTHPYTLALMREVLTGLGIVVPMEVPYRFLTKGQMLQQTHSPDLLAEFASQTNSCARPNERRASPDRPQKHCGYCVPCIIRRAAMQVAGLDDPDEYRFKVHQERSILLASRGRRQDLWAFEIALARAQYRADITDVLHAGPLPATSDEIARYVQVYRAGLDEVNSFLRGRPVFE